VFALNMNIRRCIAKYALNYLACVCNSRFALAAEFDAVREFARFGKMPDYGMVKSHFNPILADDEPAKRQSTLIHVRGNRRLLRAIAKSDGPGLEGSSYRFHSAGFR
jgi:hypothetical protein